MNKANSRMWHNSLSRSLSGMTYVTCLSEAVGTLDIVNRARIICWMTSGTPERSVEKYETKNIVKAKPTKDKTNKCPSQ